LFQRGTANFSEEQVVFSVSGQDLYGLLYRPREPSLGGVVFCAPDGEERTWSQRMLVHAARAMASDRLSVLRFDYRGQGESSGSYEQASVETRVEDILAALAFLRGRAPGAPLGILGARLGGALALAAAERAPADTLVVLWEPVLDPGAYVQELLRVNISTQTTIFKKVIRNRVKLLEDIAAGDKVSINGYNLAAPFVEGLSRLDVPGSLSRHRERCLVVRSASTKAGEPPSEGTRVLDLPVFWKEPRNYCESVPALVDVTRAWLRARMSRPE
jgi:alpha/beta superfamily hydrolase